MKLKNIVLSVIALCLLALFALGLSLYFKSDFHNGVTVGNWQEKQAVALADSVCVTTCTTKTDQGTVRTANAYNTENKIEVYVSDSGQIRSTPPTVKDLEGGTTTLLIVPLILFGGMLIWIKDG